MVRKPEMKRAKVIRLLDESWERRDHPVYTMDGLEKEYCAVVSSKAKPYYPYPISIYFFAFLPDFGSSACSATGTTEAAAVRRLRQVQKAVTEHYRKTGRKLPVPSVCPALTGLRW